MPGGRAGRVFDPQHSEVVFHRKLEDAWSVGVADRLARAKTRVGHKVAELLKRHTIAARRTDRVVLDGVDVSTVRYIEVGSIEQIECLGLQQDRVILAETNAARDPGVYLDNPRTIERK